MRAFLPFAVALAVSPAAAATLTVGPGQQYATIAAAVAASQDGDTLAVQAGTYINDFAEITTRIALVGVGGRVTMRATEALPNQKGILIIDTDVSITGFTFIGAHIAADLGANGAGIRHQGGNLTLTACWLHNNQEGLLSTPPAPTVNVIITKSEFDHNGVPSGPNAGYEHNLYVNSVAVLDIEASYLHDALVGHELKSRALTTIVNNSRIVDGPTSTSSYSIDLPNGGAATVTNTQIEQGPLGQNSNMIAYGEEGNLNPGSLTLQNVLLESDETYAPPAGILNAASMTATATGLTIWGLTEAQIAVGPVDVSGVNFPATEPMISTRHPW